MVDHVRILLGLGGVLLLAVASWLLLSAGGASVPTDAPPVSQVGGQQREVGVRIAGEVAPLGGAKAVFESRQALHEEPLPAAIPRRAPLQPLDGAPPVLRVVEADGSPVQNAWLRLHDGEGRDVWMGWLPPGREQAEVEAGLKVHELERVRWWSVHFEHAGSTRRASDWGVVESPEITLRELVPIELLLQGRAESPAMDLTLRFADESRAPKHMRKLVGFSEQVRVPLLARTRLRQVPLGLRVEFQLDMAHRFQWQGEAVRKTQVMVYRSPIVRVVDLFPARFYVLRWVGAGDPPGKPPATAAPMRNFRGTEPGILGGPVATPAGPSGNRYLAVDAEGMLRFATEEQLEAGRIPLAEGAASHGQLSKGIASFPPFRPLDSWPGITVIRKGSTMGETAQVFPAAHGHLFWIPETTPTGATELVRVDGPWELVPAAPPDGSQGRPQLHRWDPEEDARIAFWARGIREGNPYQNGGPPEVR